MNELEVSEIDYLGSLEREMLDIIATQHKALDLLLASLARYDDKFYPNKSRAWDAVLAGTAMLKRMDRL